MKILIIGGSGFVSGEMARVALTAGHEVWALTRGQRPLPAGAIPLTADRHDAAAMERAIASAGTSWDLAAVCIGDGASDAQLDIALFRPRVGHLVFVSSDFVYAPAFRQVPQNEDNTHYVGEGNSRWGKVQYERQLRQADTGSMRWTIVRPCHIYGPGSELGCLPAHGRDPQLLHRLRSGEALQLVGGGLFLQQPIFVTDLVRTMLSCAGNAATHRQFFNLAGPAAVESRTYYEIIAESLNVPLRVEAVPVEPFLAANPAAASFLCHRVYSLKKLADLGVSVPATPLATGLQQQVRWLASQGR